MTDKPESPGPEAVTLRLPYLKHYGGDRAELVIEGVPVAALAACGFVPQQQLTEAKVEVEALKADCAAWSDTAHVHDRVREDLRSQLTAANALASEQRERARFWQTQAEQREGWLKERESDLAIERAKRERLELSRQASLDIIAEEYPKLGAEWRSCLAFVLGALGAGDLHDKLQSATPPAPAPAEGGHHGGAGGGDEDGYDMTGINGGPTHRDVRNWAKALAIGPTTEASLLRYVDRNEKAEGAKAAEGSLPSFREDVLLSMGVDWTWYGPEVLLDEVNEDPADDDETDPERIKHQRNVAEKAARGHLLTIQRLEAERAALVELLDKRAIDNNEMERTASTQETRLVSGAYAYAYRWCRDQLLRAEVEPATGEAKPVPEDPPRPYECTGEKPCGACPRCWD